MPPEQTWLEQVVTNFQNLDLASWLIVILVPPVCLVYAFLIVGGVMYGIPESFKAGTKIGREIRESRDFKMSRKAPIPPIPPLYQPPSN